MTAHKTSASKYAALAAGVLAFVATKLLPAPPGLPETGFQILGVLVSAIVLFLSWGTGWTSMAVVFALMTVAGGKRIAGHSGYLRQQHGGVSALLLHAGPAA